MVYIQVKRQPIETDQLALDVGFIKEFKAVIINMFRELKKNMALFWMSSEELSIDKWKLKILNRNSRANKYKTKLKSSLDGLNDILDMAEERNSELEDRAIEMSNPNKRQNKDWGKMRRTSETWGNNIQMFNTHITRVPEAEEKNLYINIYIFEEIITENFSKGQKKTLKSEGKVFYFNYGFKHVYIHQITSNYTI